MTPERNAFPPEHLAVCTLAERPELREQLFSAEFGAAVPQFLRHDLTAALYYADSALEERKVIDRAKAILMNAKSLSEEAAYALLRKTAMNENKKIAEVAQSVVTAAELLR